MSIRPVFADCYELILYVGSTTDESLFGWGSIGRYSTLLEVIFGVETLGLL